MRLVGTCWALASKIKCAAKHWRCQNACARSKMHLKPHARQILAFHHHIGHRSVHARPHDFGADLQRARKLGRLALVCHKLRHELAQHWQCVRAECLHAAKSGFLELRLWWTPRWARLQAGILGLLTGPPLLHTHRQRDGLAGLLQGSTSALCALCRRSAPAGDLWVLRQC